MSGVVRRRCLSALAVGLLLLAALALEAPASEASDGCPCIQLTWVGNESGQATVTAAELAASPTLQNENYEIRSPAGTISDPASDVLTMADLIAQFSGLTSSQVTFVEITDSFGRPSVLSASDVFQPDFQEGLQAGVFDLNSSNSVGYTRPLRSSTDINVGDHFQTDAGQPLQVTVHTSGQLVHPIAQVNASKTSLTAHFSVTVPDMPAAATVTSYAWSFGDAGTSTMAAPTHTYADAGTYGTDVIVRASDGSLGISNVVLAAVGKPAPSSGHHPGSGTSHPTTGPTTGPQHSSGSTSGGRIAPHATSGSTSGTSSGTEGDTSSASPPSKKGTHQAQQSTIQVDGVVLTNALDPETENAKAATAASARAGSTAGQSIAWGTWAVIVGIALLPMVGGLREWRGARR